MYTGTLRFVNQTEDQILTVLALAHKYGVTKLEDSIQNYAVKLLLTHSNFLKFLEFTELYKYEKLNEGCFSLIDENPSEFPKKEGFQTLSAECVNAIISRESLVLEEKDTK